MTLLVAAPRTPQVQQRTVLSSPQEIATAGTSYTATVPVDSHNPVAVSLSQPNPGSTSTFVGTTAAPSLHTTSTTTDTPEQVLLGYVSEIIDQMRIPATLNPPISSVVDLFSTRVLESLSTEKRRDIKSQLGQIVHKLTEVAKDRAEGAKATSDAAIDALFKLATDANAVRPDQPVVNHVEPKIPLARFVADEARDALINLVRDRGFWYVREGSMNAAEQVRAKKETLAILEPRLLAIAQHDPEATTAQATSFLVSSYGNNTGRERVDLALRLLSTAITTKPEPALRGILHSAYVGQSRIHGSDSNSEQILENLAAIERIVTPLLQQQQPMLTNLVNQITHEINKSREAISGHKVIIEARLPQQPIATLATTQQPGVTVPIVTNQPYTITT